MEKSQNIFVRFGKKKKKKKKNPILCLLRMAGSFVPLRGSARRLDQSVAQKLGYLLISCLYGGCEILVHKNYLAAVSGRGKARKIFWPKKPSYTSTI